MYVLLQISVRAEMRNTQTKCKIIKKKSYAFLFQVCPSFCTILYFQCLIEACAKLSEHRTYGKWMLTLFPNCKLDENPLSAVHNCILHVSVAVPCHSNNNNLLNTISLAFFSIRRVLLPQHYLHFQD